MQRNPRALYIPSIVLTNDRRNKNYMFILTDEKGNSTTNYNKQNEISLNDTLRLCLHRHVLKQDSSKITAIPNSKYKLMKETTNNISENNKKQKPSVNDKQRDEIRNFKNWLKSPIDLERNQR